MAIPGCGSAWSFCLPRSDPSPICGEVMTDEMNENSFSVHCSTSVADEIKQNRSGGSGAELRIREDGRKWERRCSGVG